MANPLTKTNSYIEPFLSIFSLSCKDLERLTRQCGRKVPLETHYLGHFCRASFNKEMRYIRPVFRPYVRPCSHFNNPGACVRFSQTILPTSIRPDRYWQHTIVYATAVLMCLTVPFFSCSVDFVEFALTLAFSSISQTWYILPINNGLHYCSVVL